MMFLTSVGDFVWEGTNKNGIQDGGELGIGGVLVKLYKEGVQVDETTTESNGLYLFTTTPGTYTVKIDESNFVQGGPLEGMSFSPVDQGDDALDSDGGPGHEATVTLAIAEHNPTIDFGYYTAKGECLVIIDEECIDNDLLTIEQAAHSHGVEPDWLINEDRPTEYGNPWLCWNDYFPGDVVLLPTGEVDDEGWFALSPTIRYADDRTTDLTDEEWFEAFVAGTLPQEQLDKLRDVMPLRNQELVQLVGKTCVAIVYDSDVSMNYEPVHANLQGARYGKFAFTVLAVEVPGSIPESQSSTSLYDLWVHVEHPLNPDERFDVIVRDHEPDSIEITRASTIRIGTNSWCMARVTLRSVLT